MSCCDAMKYALDEGYLYVPIQVDTETGQLKPMSPAILGPNISPRSRKHKPSIVLSYCPFCKKKIGEKRLW
jgi:hypothetical protein